MKVGFIVECGPAGAETKILPYLAQRLNPAIKPDVVPLESKAKLVSNCGTVAHKFLATGFARVMIVWDLLPPWTDYEKRGCHHEDKAAIGKSLKAAGLKPGDTRIRLVCIEKMLEAWLIADERAIRAFLSTPAHLAQVPRRKRPEEISDPKSALITLFRKSGSRINRYQDRTHAIEIAKRMPDLTRLQKLASFTYFESKL